MALKILILLGFIFDPVLLLSIDKIDLNKQCNANWKRLQLYGIQRPDLDKFDSSRRFVFVILNHLLSADYFLVSDKGLEICDKTASICCNRNIEDQLYALSLQKYQSLVNKQIYPIRSAFINFAAKFGRTSF